MKKILLMLSIFLLIPTFVIAESPTNVLLDEIKNILNLALEKLDVIAEKELSVTVEPPAVNIDGPIDTNVLNTIDVNVLSEPNKECEWEKINQELRFDGTTVIYLELPKDKTFSEAIISNVSLSLASCFNNLHNGGACPIKVNDNSCTSIPFDKTIHIENLCPEQFKIGLNKVEMIIPSEHFSGAFKDLFFEMEIKPANC